MSRSRRKTPIAGVAKARSERLWKRHLSHRRRQQNRLAVMRGDELADVPAREPILYGPKDGKRWYRDLTWMSPDKLESDIMRK